MARLPRSFDRLGAGEAAAHGDLSVAAPI